MLSNKFGPINCSIRDRTAMGAQVRLAKLIELPRKFDFVTLPSGEVKNVRLIWQHGTLAGLRFTA